MKLLAAIALLAACPGPGKPPPPPPSGGGSVIAAPADAPAPPDDAEVSQEEKLAAIQKAMNELDEAAQGCWAVAATERFDIEGEIAALVDIVGAGRAKITLARDTTRNRKLALCLTALLENYPWAPPLHGQAIQLPFKFRAPNGQNVIDRNLVPWNGQGKIAVAVLLDENNTGNGAASVIELAIQAGGSTGARIAERAELWYFLGNGTVEVTGAANRRAVKTGDMMYVPAGSARNVIADADLHAVVVIVPGGREGSARMGALPTKELGAIKSGITGPMYLPAATAKGYDLPNRGRATIFAEPATIKDKQLAAGVLEMPGNAKVAEHVHAGETELLYVLAGTGTLTVNGVELAVSPTSTIQIPPNTKHAFVASSDFRAVQIYTPAGPEQRFKAK
jgi:quercetin dioxygenase-like cupin family protein